jgi:hypothetical protein
MTAQADFKRLQKVERLFSSHLPCIAAIQFSSQHWVADSLPGDMTVP